MWEAEALGVHGGRRPWPCDLGYVPWGSGERRVITWQVVRILSLPTMSHRFEDSHHSLLRFQLGKLRTREDHPVN